MILFRIVLWVFVGSVSGVGQWGLMCTLFGKDSAVLLHRGDWNSFEHSWVEEVSFSRSISGVERLLSTTELLKSFGGRGGGISVFCLFSSRCLGIGELG